jgi:aminoglycoside phosphotransferase (APT) family kinase protein
VLHMDFHPINVLAPHHQPGCVLDWSESDVGDYHADVATTLFLMALSPVKLTRLLDRVAALPGRFLLRNRYRKAYLRHRPLDPVLLNYYLALASFRRLTRYQIWQLATPCVTGSKPSALQNIDTAGIHFMKRYFGRRTGVVLPVE